MNRIKCERRSNYTTINNTVVKDKRISLKAKGLMLTVMSLPPTWDFSVRGLTKVLKEKRDALNAAIEELIAYGYVSREKSRNVSGKFEGWDYTFREEPVTEAVKAENGRTEYGKSDFGKSAPIKYQGINS